MIEALARERVARLATATLALALLAGCVRTGDFGRPQPSAWNDGIDATGALAARMRGEAVSSLPLTDDEDELRKRTFRFLMPAKDASAFEAALANLVRTRVLPRDLLPADPTAYYRGIMGTGFRSPTSRYRRLADDVHADRALLRPLRVLAGRVLGADLARGRALAQVADLNSVERDEAIARMDANAGLVAWVREAVAVRVCQYRYALEHLTVAAPQADAVPVERMIQALDAEQAMLDEIPVALPAAPLAGAVATFAAPLPACRAVVYALPETAAAAPLVRKF